MRTKLRGKVTLLFMTFALMLALPAMALADLVTVSDANTLQASGDATKQAGQTGTARFHLLVNDNQTDPVNGCNAQPNNPVTVAVSSTAKDANGNTITSPVTFASPGSVQLTACDNANTTPTIEGAQTLGYTVSNTAQVGDVITVTAAASGGRQGGIGTYSYDTFTITVVAPPEQGTSLSVSPASGTYGGTTSLSATLSAAGTGVANKIVSFTLNGTSVGNATTNSSGVATLTGVSLSGINAGTYVDAVSANYAGTGSGCTTNCYGPSNGKATLTVAKAAGSVSINNIPSNAVFGGSFTPTYTKAGDGTASTTSKTESVCSVDNSGVVSFDAAGTCTLQASVTEGTNHLAATGAEQSFQIAKAQASLSFADGTLSKTYNGDPQGVTVNTNPSGLNDVEITYDGSPNAPTDAGSYAVVASLNNPNYEADQLSGTLDIDKADATIEVQGYEGVYDGNAHGASGTATGVKGEDLSSLLDLGAKYTDVPGGTANWSFAGNNNYNADSGSVDIVITKANATIEVQGYEGVYDGNAHGATGSATGVKGESLNSLLDLGDSFTNVPGGTANWSFAGNNNYNNDSGSVDIVITKATAQVTLGNLGPHVYDGSAKAASVTTTPSGLNVTVTYNGNTQAPSAVGSYNVVAKVNEQNYQGEKTGTLVISPWTLTGFYQPIDMNNTVNTVKNGSTVPVKFEIFKGGAELTSTSAVTSIKSNAISCASLSGDPEDAIETVATGATSLRYDTTAGQFIYNWATPKGANQVGKCYSLTMTAADSSTITAYFKMK